MDAIPDGISEKKKAIAAYMREHPEVTSKSAIAKAVQVDKNTVNRYYEEIRREMDGGKLVDCAKVNKTKSLWDLLWRLFISKWAIYYEVSIQVLVGTCILGEVLYMIHSI